MTDTPQDDSAAQNADSAPLHDLRQMLADRALTLTEMAENERDGRTKSRLFGKADGVDLAVGIVDRFIRDAARLDGSGVAPLSAPHDDLDDLVPDIVRVLRAKNTDGLHHAAADEMVALRAEVSRLRTAHVERLSGDLIDPLAVYVDGTPMRPGDLDALVQKLWDDGDDMTWDEWRAAIIDWRCGALARRRSQHAQIAGSGVERSGDEPMSPRDALEAALSEACRVLYPTAVHMEWRAPALAEHMAANPCIARAFGCSEQVECVAASGGGDASTSRLPADTLGGVDMAKVPVPDDSAEPSG